MCICTRIYVYLHMNLYISSHANFGAYVCVYIYMYVCSHLPEAKSTSNVKLLSYIDTKQYILHRDPGFSWDRKGETGSRLRDQ